MTQTGSRQFHMHACVGQGGFGEVYRATMRSSGGLEREVAVKTLKPSVAPDDDARRRLRDEARLLARLRHRAILQVHDIVQLGGRTALVTDYLDGQDLSGCLSGPDPLPRRAALEVIGEVASALAAAHQHLELVHRDIKPSNVRILADGSVRLLDFGIARSPKVEREGHTTAGMIVGTPGYLAPERVAEGIDGPASDVYSLGCVLYACLAYQPLFHGVPRARLLGIALDFDAHQAFLSERFAELPPGPDTKLLRGMLSGRPERRPTAARIEELCEDLSPELPGETVRRWARKRRWARPPESDGALVGRTLVEVPLVLGSAQDSHPGVSLAATTLALPAGRHTSGGAEAVPASPTVPDPGPVAAAAAPVPAPTPLEPLEPLEPLVEPESPEGEDSTSRLRTTRPSTSSGALRPNSTGGRVRPALHPRDGRGSGSSGGSLILGVLGAAVLAAGVLALAASQGALGDDAQRTFDAISLEVSRALR